MELKRLITQFAYKIEPKAGGGFIAHASDPSVPPLEGATREELQHKIQAKIAAGLMVEFPGLKLALEKPEIKFDFHIEHMPGGGFAIHASDSSAKLGSPKEGLESLIARKLMGAVGKHLSPEKLQDIAETNSPPAFKVFAAHSEASITPSRQELPSSTTPDAGYITTTGTNATGNHQNSDAIYASPIAPESSRWTSFLFVLGLLLITALIYFVLHHH